MDHGSLRSELPPWKLRPPPHPDDVPSFSENAGLSAIVSIGSYTVLWPVLMAGTASNPRQGVGAEGVRWRLAPPLLHFCGVQHFWRGPSSNAMAYFSSIGLSLSFRQFFLEGPFASYRRYCNTSSAPVSSWLISNTIGGIASGICTASVVQTLQGKKGEGVRMMYRGLPTALLRSSVLFGITFGLYDSFSVYLPNDPLQRTILAGGSSLLGSLGSSIVTRAQQRAHPSQLGYSALLSGSILGFIRVSVASAIPLAAGLVLFDTLKEVYVEYR